MCVRVLNMKGVDLSVFDFDFDLTFYAFFLSPDETIYLRYGGRDDRGATSFLSLDSLQTAMERALEAHKAYEPPKGPPPHLNDTPEKRGIKADKSGCIHCHMIKSNDWKERQSAKKWTRDEIWRYPGPANLGIDVDPKTGTKVIGVAGGSVAARAGMRVGDEIAKIDGRPVRTFGDAAYALDHVTANEFDIDFEHEDVPAIIEVKITPPAGWRRTDIAWRESQWNIPPNLGLWLEDAGGDERKKLGVGADAMALRVKAMFDKDSPAKKAGLAEGDVVIAVNDAKKKMDWPHLNVFLRVDVGPGKKVTFKVLRNGKPQDIVFTQ